jgi:uncharacterized repeat protein (TIGR03843 family)
LAAFDAIANNADRKSGHCLVDQSGRLWAIDNALTFHPEPKLRTVIWDYAGQPLPSAVVADLQRLHDDLVADSPLDQAMRPLLAEEEMAALRQRLGRLIRGRRYPTPGPGHVVPWPPV